MGKTQAAIAVFESVHGSHARASWGRDSGLYLAQALEKKGRVVESARAYHGVTIREPATWRSRQAREGLRRVERRLSKADRAFLRRRTPAQRLTRARGLDRKHRSEQVIDELGHWLKGKSAPKRGSRSWCDATFLLGKAARKLRKHGVAAGHHRRFLDRCAGHPDVVNSLFAGARSLWNVDRDAEALRWFRRVWTEFPNHSFADDSVLYAARIRAGNGKSAKSRTLLDFQVRTFPRGDMLGDAHWYLFARKYKAGRYKRALAYAKRVDGAGENSIYTRGRMGYFSGRSHENRREKKKAVTAFEAVLDRAPMSYYALLSLGRIRHLDPAAYKRVVGRLSEREAQATPWVVEPADLVEDPFFVRGVALLRLGLQAEAQREFDRLRSRRSGDVRVLWTLAVLFDRAGAYPLSHNIPRRQIEGFGQAWPVGQERGRYEVAYPRPFLEEVSRWAKNRKIPEELVYAIMREESGFSPGIRSWAGARGLMQLMVPTAETMAKDDGMGKLVPDRLFEPDTNIRLGTKFLQKLLAGYDSHVAVTISGYNGGFGNVDRWLGARGKQPLDLWVEDIPFGQTRHYTKRVLTTMWIYRWLYGTGEDRILAVPQKLPPPSGR
jgi:soluble lytic murein transglycosylase